jgi:HAD superfamily hydrolase (TIGR01662 family)
VRRDLPFRLWIFDADGTLRRTLVPGQPCPHAPDEWALIPGVAEHLYGVPWGDDVRLGIASNQDHVAYGHLSETMARALLADMAYAATGHTPPKDAVQLCPHALDVPCDCRKPAPGMLRRIMDYYDVTPDETLFVGDAEVDAAAARNAGVTFAWADDFFTRTVER